MDLNRIIQMIVNSVIRKLVGRAVDHGIDYASRGGKDPSEMTQAERDQSRSAKDVAKRARQVSRLTRRF
jgi:hypothetical protein